MKKHFQDSSRKMKAPKGDKGMKRAGAGMHGPTKPTLKTKDKGKSKVRR